MPALVVRRAVGEESVWQRDWLCRKRGQGRVARVAFRDGLHSSGLALECRVSATTAKGESEIMMTKEAMGVFWQTLKDVWEELLPLCLVNLVWLFASLTVILFPVTLAGGHYVANRVARGKTFGTSDYIDGIKMYWWRSLLWFLANLVVVLLIYTNVMFYPSQFQGLWVSIVGGLWVALLIFWLTLQMYFWPLLIEQEEPRMLLAWRNSAYLVLINPFYAFFVASFHILFLAVSVATQLPLVFVGMVTLAILENNAVLAILVSVGKIEDPRPKLTV